GSRPSAPRQLTKRWRLNRNVIPSVGLAGNDCLVRDRLVGIAGEESNFFRTRVASHVQPGPSEMGFAFDDKSEAEIAVLHVYPGAGTGLAAKAVVHVEAHERLGGIDSLPRLQGIREVENPPKPFCIVPARPTAHDIEGSSAAPVRGAARPV